MTCLIRCTAARAPCKRSCGAVPMGATSLTRRPAPLQEEPRLAWSGATWAYLRLRKQPTRLRSSSARTPDPNWRAMLFARAAAVLCCRTLLLYEPPEPYDRIFEL